MCWVVDVELFESGWLCVGSYVCGFCLVVCVFLYWFVCFCFGLFLLNYCLCSLC